MRWGWRSRPATTASRHCSSKPPQPCSELAKARTGPSAREPGRCCNRWSSCAGPGPRCSPTALPGPKRPSAGCSPNFRNGKKRPSGLNLSKWCWRKRMSKPASARSPAMPPNSAPVSAPMPPRQRTCSNRAAVKPRRMCCWRRRAPASARRWAISLRPRCGRRNRAAPSGSRHSPRRFRGNCGRKAARPGRKPAPMAPGLWWCEKGAKTTCACSTWKTRCRAASAGGRRSWRSWSHAGRPGRRMAT